MPSAPACPAFILPNKVQEPFPFRDICVLGWKPGGHMLDITTRKLGDGLPPISQIRLRDIASHRKPLRPREDLARQGETLHEAYIVLDGILCRYKLLAGGARAVVAYLLPGDTCGFPPDNHRRLDHGICSLTPATVAEVSHHMLQDCMKQDAALAQRFVAAFVAETAIQRQWLANMGCASDKRLAHLLCELRARLARIGQADERSFLLPLTQHDLSETLGISTVHVNRVLQHLKDMGLVRIMDRRVMIGDLAMLESFAEFDPSYLDVDGDHGTRGPQRLSASA